MKTIGYLVPEFPGQTHNFFWREVKALTEYGIRVKLYSTRRPPPGIQSTSWGLRAADDTTYLHPLNRIELAKAALALLFSPVAASRTALCLFSSIGKRNKGETRIRLFGLMITGVWLGQHLTKHGINHIHVHSCADSANVALFAHVSHGVKYSITLHNPLSIWGGNQENKWSHASFAIVITHRILDDLRAKLGDLLPKSIHVAPMGVDLDVFKRVVPYQPRITEPLRIFSCARLNPAKGFSVLLRAVELIKRSGLSLVLSIAGEDDRGGTGYRKEVEALVSTLGLRGDVILLGSISEEKVREELERAHLFVLASIEEPLGVAIMEAMAMEVPVISTNAGGVPELLSNECGVLVPPNDFLSLADAILRLAENPSEAVSCSTKGRARIQRSYHHKVSAQLISELC